MGEVGVVAVGKNEGERLRRCLRTVLGQGMTVVYVDSASDDGSPEFAREAGAEVVALDMSLAFSAARARREGFERLLKVDPGLRYVQFIDGDCEVVKGWIDRARGELDARPEVAVVCGRRTERHPEHSVYNRLADMAWNGPPGETTACGGDSLMRVDALRAADGGWNPRAMIGEEAELCIRLRALGWKVVRLDAPMTVHDMAMTQFGQWWRRTARTGYGFAEGVARHGSGPERHMVREHRSVLFWGLMLPLASLALAWPTYGLSLALLAAYPLLYARIILRKRRDHWTPHDARLYAGSCVVGKFAQALGVGRFWWRWLLGKEGVWIEYKDASRGGSGKIEGVESPRARLGLSAAAGVFCMLVSVTASALFLPHQSLWFDEAVQLGGITLGPVEQVRWLTGRVQYPICVASDRMPPLSYWAGWIWSRTVGGGEVPMRWLGVAAVAMATLLVFLAAKRAWGLGPALAAGLLFGLSPNVVVQAVEIRAYPLLLLASSAALYCLTRLLTDPVPGSTTWLAALAACGVLATYTHFFGLVLAGATLLAALVLVPARGGRRWPVVLACVVVGALSVGLAPFVAAAVGVSGDTPPPLKEKVVGLFRLGYRLVSHPAMSVSRAAVGLGLLGAAAAALAALTPKRRAQEASTGLLLALASGGAVVALAQFATSKFGAANPSYNVWMLPALALWLASGLASTSRVARRVAVVAVTLLLASDAYAVAQLAVHGDFFAHTPLRALEDPIKRYGPNRVAVVHDGDGKQAWNIYTPLLYDFGGGLRNYVNDPRESGPPRVVDYPDRMSAFDPLTLPADYLIVARTVLQGADEVTAQVRGGVRPPIDGPVAAALKADPRWLLVSNSAHATFFLVDLAVFKRVNAD